MQPPVCTEPLYLTIHSLYCQDSSLRVWQSRTELPVHCNLPLSWVDACFPLAKKAAEEYRALVWSSDHVGLNTVDVLAWRLVVTLWPYYILATSSVVIPNYLFEVLQRCKHFLWLYLISFSAFPIRCLSPVLCILTRRQNLTVLPAYLFQEICWEDRSYSQDFMRSTCSTAQMLVFSNPFNKLSPLLNPLSIKVSYVGDAISFL